MSTDAVDMFGKEIAVGDRVARACTSGRAVNLEICAVTRAENGKIYLDNSKVAVNYPGRLLVINALFPAPAPAVE